MSVQDYLAFDAAAPDGLRYEYWDGVVLPVHGYAADGVTAMAGAGPAHNQITGNLVAALHGPMTAKGCRVGVGDLRVRTEAGRYGYPDVVFVCDEPVYTEDVPPVLLNPTLIIEVSSPSTAARDRGTKMRTYTQSASLVEYWLVESSAAEITRVARTADGWSLHFATGRDAVLASDALGVAVALADVYRLVEWALVPPETP